MVEQMRCATLTVGRLVERADRICEALDEIEKAQAPSARFVITSVRKTTENIMMTMIIEPEIETRLEVLGATTEESKLALLRKTLLSALEDLEDLRMAEEVLANPGKRYSLEEVERELGVED